MVVISLIVAAAENDVIGADGDMPWKLSTDLKRFKALTLGKPMVMGRKTFDSIGRPLPGRTTIVVTRDTTWQHEGVVVANTLDIALDVASEIAEATEVDEVCVVGGGQIYRQAMVRASVIHLTRVHTSPEGDTTFPTIDPDDWKEVSVDPVEASERDSAGTTYTIYKRR